MEYKGIKYEVKNFSEKYKEHKIENPTNNEDAKYYILYYREGCVYLQAHKPFTSGFEAITNENAEEIIKEHIDKLLEEQGNQL